MRSLILALSTVTTALQAGTRGYGLLDWLSGVAFVVSMIVLIGILPLVVVFLLVPTFVSREMSKEERQARRREAWSHPEHRVIVGGLVGAVVGLSLVVAVVASWSPLHTTLTGLRESVVAIPLAIVVPLISIVVFALVFRRAHD